MAYVFANNRGGAGKSTLAYQLVSQHAQAHPERQVLLVDFSLQGDASHLMLGGKEVTTKNTAAALLRSLAEEKRSLASRFAGLLIRTEERKPMEASDVAVSVVELHPESTQPSNLWLCPSTPDLVEAALELSTGAEFKAAALELRRRISQRAGLDVFFDTDAELMERSPSMLALSAADRLLLPLSTSQNDFRRIVSDPRNALFSALRELEKRELPHARIDRVIFNRVPKHRNFATRLHAENMSTDAVLLFTPVAAAQEQMASLSDKMRDIGWVPTPEAPDYRRFFHKASPKLSHGEFAERYVSALFEISGVSLQESSSTGVPLCAMTNASDALEKIQSDLSQLACDLQ